MRSARLVLVTTLAAGLFAAPVVAADHATPDLLPGVDLVTEEVEPGVYRVVSDGVRELRWELDGFWNPYEQPAVVSDDTGTWVAVQDSGVQLGEPGAFEVGWDTDRPGGVDIVSPWAIDLVRGERGETVWTESGGTLRRSSPRGSEVFTEADGIPVSKGIAPMIGLRTVTAPDGAGWFSLYDSLDRNPIAPSDCGGLARFDGRSSVYFLQNQGFCVAGLDVDSVGNVWVLGWSHVLQDLARSLWNDGPAQLHVITPEAVAAEQAVAVEPTDDAEPTDTSATSPDLLPGVDHVTEEVEPGVSKGAE